MAPNKPGTSCSVADTRAELEELLKQKTEIGEELKSLERQIYSIEGSYLEDTRSYGNIITGWNGYLAKNKKSRTKANKNQKSSEAERLFSNSSTTSTAALSGLLNTEESGNADEKNSSDAHKDCVSNHKPKNHTTVHHTTVDHTTGHHTTVHHTTVDHTTGHHTTVHHTTVDHTTVHHTTVHHTLDTAGPMGRHHTATGAVGSDQDQNVSKSTNASRRSSGEFSSSILTDEIDVVTIDPEPVPVPSTSNYKSGRGGARKSSKKRQRRR